MYDVYFRFPIELDSFSSPFRAGESEKFPDQSNNKNTTISKMLKKPYKILLIVLSNISFDKQLIY